MFHKFHTIFSKDSESTLKTNIIQTKFSYFTAPAGVPSINSSSDAALSATACLDPLKWEYGKHDAYLICCYSAHPLVAQTRTEQITYAARRRRSYIPPVAGIFEASLVEALQGAGKFGIVSTGAQWEGLLSDAVKVELGEVVAGERFVGTETTGFDADELHVAPAEIVGGRIKEATKRLLSKGAGAICLGCAGMVGLEGVVRDACCEALGEVEGGKIRIINGVVSGIKFLRGEL
jgi:Asp/Glu/hydantoin racemase